MANKKNDKIDLNISDSSIEIDRNNPSIEKMTRILKQVKYHFDSNIDNKELLKNLNWVIKKIETNSIYSTENFEVEDEFEKDDEKNRFLDGYLNNSYIDDIKKKSRERVCRTFHRHNLEGFKSMEALLESKNMVKKITFNDMGLEKIEENRKEEYSPEKSRLKSTTKDFKKKNTMTAGITKEDVKLSSEFELDKVIVSQQYKTIKDEKLTSYKINGKELGSHHDNYDMNFITTRYFNIFHFESIFSREKSFVLIGKECFKALDLLNIIDTTKLSNFLLDLRNYYISSNEYHNERHGADVGQTISSYLKNSEIIELCMFPDIDILSILISAFGHDVGHTGQNNNFHINSKSVYALTYHDKSCLENYHIYLVFKILLKPENNIVNSMKNEEFKILRKRIIESILATDMSLHDTILSKIQTKLLSWNDTKKENPNELFINPESTTLFDDQQKIINLLIHSADIAHNTKPFILSEKWTELLTEEFHAQGDKEKSLNIPISFLCDRTTSNVPKSQIGFLNYVIIPTFQLVKDAFPSLYYLVDIANENKKVWEEKNNQSLLSTNKS